MSAQAPTEVPIDTSLWAYATKVDGLHASNPGMEAMFQQAKATFTAASEKLTAEHTKAVK
ncbi:uncharacterized protein N7496_005508 [Penicillium cataractarum]|uniref:Uncharacterized protein n=1 Tax=Penicillium cataractarum TaxID=2100454 RepID=A0A9W9VEQ6_9EURO|nr:uncharacterized protein N7496_005508 [Penicillium cataractarum]KAJ5378099.1 hypothetical protein N7496_005508 [Penicillium cataractarum]